MTGRPSTYSEETGQDICQHIAQGGSLRDWCDIEGHPHFSTVYDWLEREEVFADAYARARERQAHNDADRLNQLARRVADGELDPNAARVAADILKWTASKRLSRAYGDKVTVGNDSNAPLIITWANGDKV